MKMEDGTYFAGLERFTWVKYSTRGGWCL